MGEVKSGRPDPKDTARRYIAMLRHLPMRGGITVAALAARLERDGFSVSKRSLERDLAKLSEHWSIVDEGRPARWRWRSGDKKSEALASLDPAIAIALLRLAQYGQGTLPESLLHEFEGWFEAARASIKSYADYRHAAARDREKFRRVPDRLMLAPPPSHAGVLDAVLEATLEGHQLEVDYHGREGEGRTRVLHPACIVEKGAATYVLATDPGSDELKQFALHRFRRANVLAAPAIVPSPAVIDACIVEKQSFQYQREPSPIRLRLRCSYRMTTRFNEAKLAPDQVLSPAGQDGRFELRATVANTEALVWFLREFGPDIEVLEPKALRAEFARDARALAETYRRRVGSELAR
jgi:predicted DNA-binding transcriptional regulator YafY